MLHAFRSYGRSSQKLHVWIHSWSVWQLCFPSWRRLPMQRRWQEVHCRLQSWTLTLSSWMAPWKVRRSSSMLAWPVRKRSKFESIHARTWFTRWFTILSKYDPRSATHSASGMYCRVVVRSHSDRSAERIRSRSDACTSTPDTNSIDEVSELSTGRSVSKFLGAF